MEKKKSVFIPTDEVVKEHYYEGVDSFDSDCMRQSSHRRLVEGSVFRSPSTEIDRLRRVISSWREHDTSIVFGNLGRQPYLLDFYLDMCFSHREEVSVECRWKLQSPYQIESLEKEVDFLFLVEPNFGDAIRKPERAKRLVVLTSHLSLSASDHDKRYYSLHLTSKRKYDPPRSDLREGTVFKPPIFHEQRIDSLPDEPVFLDVRGSKSANEAYLRLLTGKEMIGKRPYKILMDDRDREILKRILPETERKIKNLGFVSWKNIFYCRI